MTSNDLMVDDPINEDVSGDLQKIELEMSPFILIDKMSGVIANILGISDKLADVQQRQLWSRFSERQDVRDFARVINWLKKEGNEILILDGDGDGEGIFISWYGTSILDRIDRILLERLEEEGIIAIEFHGHIGARTGRQGPAYNYFSNLPSQAAAMYEIEGFLSRRNA